MLLIINFRTGALLLLINFGAGAMLLIVISGNGAMLLLPTNIGTWAMLLLINFRTGVMLLLPTNFGTGALLLLRFTPILLHAYLYPHTSISSLFSTSQSWSISHSSTMHRIRFSYLFIPLLCCCWCLSNQQSINFCRRNIREKICTHDMRRLEEQRDNRGGFWWGVVCLYGMYALVELMLHLTGCLTTSTMSEWRSC